MHKDMVCSSDYRTEATHIWKPRLAPWGADMQWRPGDQAEVRKGQEEAGPAWPVEAVSVEGRKRQAL